MGFDGALGSAFGFMPAGAGAGFFPLGGWRGEEEKGARGEG